MKLFPDWQQRLIDWSIDKIKEDEAEAMSQGEDSTYCQLVDLFINLDRAGLLKDWLETFKIQETELEATFQKIEIRVLERKEKNDLIFDKSRSVIRHAKQVKEY